MSAWPRWSRSARLGVSAVVAVLAGGAGLVAAVRLPPAAAPPSDSQGRVVLARVPGGGLQPQVMLDGHGRVHLVYFSGDPARGNVYYTRLRDDGTATLATPIRVNSEPASAIATGNVRGAHLAIGRNGRVHVSWAGSQRATPRGPGGAPPMFYTHMDAGGSAFAPERNVEQVTTTADGGAVAADPDGNVYVAWHGTAPGSGAEADGRLWIARSSDNGETFAREAPVSPPALGACGCCGVGALAGAHGQVYVLFRSAWQTVHRDTHLLVSTDRGATFSDAVLQDWTLGACPLSTFALADAPNGAVAAWETAGQVQFVRLDADGRPTSAPVEAPGTSRTRKHPALAANAQGDVALAWTENMAWARGGSVAWQVFDAAGRPTAAHGRRDGVPAWSLVAVYARPDGGFTILY